VTRKVQASLIYWHCGVPKSKSHLAR